jgi:hypothetical protein
MAPASVRYTYSWDDYVALDRALRKDNVWKRHQLIIVPVFLTLCMAGLVIGMNTWNGRSITATIPALLSTPYFWLAPFAFVPLILGANRIERGIWYKRQKIDGVEVTVRFDDPGGLSLSTRDGAGVIAWRAIRKVTGEATMHVVLQDNRMVGVCLPRRAFASDAEFDGAKAFIEQKAREHREAA